MKGAHFKDVHLQKDEDEEEEEVGEEEKDDGVDNEARGKIFTNFYCFHHILFSLGDYIVKGWFRIFYNTFTACANSYPK